MNEGELEVFDIVAEELVYWEQASQADENQLVEVQIRADEWQLGRMAIVHEANLSLEQRFMAA